MLSLRWCVVLLLSIFCPNTFAGLELGGAGHAEISQIINGSSQTNSTFLPVQIPPNGEAEPIIMCYESPEYTIQVDDVVCVEVFFKYISRQDSDEQKRWNIDDTPIYFRLPGKPQCIISISTGLGNDHFSIREIMKRAEQIVNHCAPRKHEGVGGTSTIGARNLFFVEIVASAALPSPLVSGPGVDGSGSRLGSAAVPRTDTTEDNSRS